MNILIFTLFFISGASALIYQVVWSRIMTHVFGSTVLAVGIVLAAFMAGLAIGSFLLGRRGDKSSNPMRLYAWYEMAIGLAALASLFCMDRILPLYLWMHQILGHSSAVFSVIHFVIAFFLIMIPTILMGATLPILSRVLIRSITAVGRSLSSLYTVNTVGAVAGSMFAGFYLIGHFGIHPTFYIAVIANIAIGLFAWYASRFFTFTVQIPTALSLEKIPIKHSSSETAEIGEYRLLLWALGLSGFTSFAYEIYFTRSLVFLIGNSTYAFTMMLTTFLSGIALGGYAIRFFADRAGYPIRLFAWCQMLIGISAATVLPLLFSIVSSSSLQAFLAKMSEETGALILSRFGVSMLVMLFPATLIGATFPLAGRVYVKDLALTGASVGKIYAVNTVGNVAGALFPVIAIIPLLGIQKGILLAAALNVSIGAAILLNRNKGRRRLTYAVPVIFICCGFLLSRIEIGFQFPSEVQTDSHEVLFYREGPSATTKVFLNPENQEKLISIDGIVIGGTGLTDMKQQIIAHLPKLLLKTYESELTIGIGSGILIGESGLHRGLKKMVGVEIEPSVVEGALYFQKENHDILHDPRMQVIIDDGANYIRTSSETFDIISADEKSAMNYATNGLSYSSDYYTLLRDHLTPDGLVIQWLPPDNLPPRQYRMVLRTFAGIFPHVSLWYFSPVGKTGATSFLIGSKRPIRIDYAWMKEIMKTDRASFGGLRKYGISTADALLAHYIGNDEAIREATRGARKNSLERPFYEFYSPRDYAMPIAERSIQNHDLLFSIRASDLSGVMSGASASEISRLQKTFDAEAEFLKGYRLFLENRPPSEITEQFHRAFELAPWNESLRYEIFSYFWFLARYYLMHGTYSTAYEHMSQAMELYDKNGESHYDLGRILLKMGRANEGYQVMLRALSLHPGLAGPRRYLQPFSSPQVLKR